MTNLTKKEKNRRLAESALMLALATILSKVAISLLHGGSVTLFSQVPIILISYRYGVKWGFKTGLAMSVLQLILGLENFSYVSGIVSFLVVGLCDYLIAFSALGFGGMFKNKIKNDVLAISLGSAIVVFVRFVCHFISGATVWSGYANDKAAVVYSLTYNGSYMLPEFIITIVGVALIAGIYDLNSLEFKTKFKKNK